MRFLGPVVRAAGVWARARPDDHVLPLWSPCRRLAVRAQLLWAVALARASYASIVCKVSEVLGGVRVAVPTARAYLLLCFGALMLCWAFRQGVTW